MAIVIDPSEVAKGFRQELRARIEQLPAPIKLVGFLSTDMAPSMTYANYTKSGCDDVKIEFELRQVSKLHLEKAIDAANSDPGVHGMIVYYPIFGTARDAYIKDLVDHRKDIEGLNTFWARMLYHNQRFVDPGQTKKALLPCTPLAIAKLIEAARAALPKPANPAEGPLAGATVTIFNRSEVVGRPLATMLSNDGAEVYSFDLDGALLFNKGYVLESAVTRAEALAQSDIVITGVPSRDFPLVTTSEIKPGALCINFSTLRNFVPEICERAGAFIPRVGPMTVAMALRNTLRLYDNYHA